MSDRIYTVGNKVSIPCVPLCCKHEVDNKIVFVATTSIGAEGLTNCNDEIAIFNEDNQWIEGLCSLLPDRNRRIVMGQLARKYIINYFSSEIVERQFWKFIEGE